MSFLNYLFDNVVEAIKDLKGFKFYFVVILVFLFATTYMCKDAITLYVKSHTDIQFRECRDAAGLSKALDIVIKEDTVTTSYIVYLYEPINNSIYKRMVVTDNLNVLHSPALQGIYLNTQPTLSKELQDHDYYLADNIEIAKHPDTQYWLSFGNETILVYALKANGKVIGEIWFKFKRSPTPLELEKVLRKTTPLLYNYIL